MGRITEGVAAAIVLRPHLQHETQLYSCEQERGRLLLTDMSKSVSPLQTGTMPGMALWHHALHWDSGWAGA